MRSSAHVLVGRAVERDQVRVEAAQADDAAEADERDADVDQRRRRVLERLQEAIRVQRACERQLTCACAMPHLSPSRRRAQALHTVHCTVCVCVLDVPPCGGKAWRGQVTEERSAGRARGRGRGGERGGGSGGEREMRRRGMCSALAASGAAGSSAAEARRQ